MLNLRNLSKKLSINAKNSNLYRSGGRQEQNYNLHWRMQGEISETWLEVTGIDWMGLLLSTKILKFFTGCWERECPLELMVFNGFWPADFHMKKKCQRVKIKHTARQLSWADSQKEFKPIQSVGKRWESFYKRWFLALVSLILGN